MYTIKKSFNEKHFSKKKYRRSLKGEIVKHTRDCYSFLESIGLKLHPKKTQIFPLKKGIKYLGFHFYLTDTGGVYIKLASNSEKRMKRKIRKMANMGKSDAEIKRSFYAWAAHASYGNNYYRIKRNENYMFRVLQQRREENA